MNIKEFCKNPNLKTIDDFINEVNNQIFKIKNPEKILNRDGYFIQKDNSLLDPYYDVGDIVKRYSDLLWDIQLHNIQIMSPLNYDKHTFSAFLKAKNLSNETIVKNIHSDLFNIYNELIRINNEKVVSEKSDELLNILDFDELKKVLLFMREEVLISNSRKTKQFRAFKFIFDNKNEIPSKLLELDNYVEQTNNTENDVDDIKLYNKYYLIIKTINEKIKKKTNIDDFIILKADIVCINKAYLRF